MPQCSNLQARRQKSTFSQKRSYGTHQNLQWYMERRWLVLSQPAKTPVRVLLSQALPPSGLGWGSVFEAHYPTGYNEG